MIAIGEPGMAHGDASRVNQSLIHQFQLLFGYGKQRRQSPICQATPHDVRLGLILRWHKALMSSLIIATKKLIPLNSLYPQ